MRRAARHIPRSAALLAASPLGVQRRNFEYWGLHIGPRTQPYALGEKVSASFNATGVLAVDNDALYLTGNNCGIGYNQEQMFDTTAELDRLRKHQLFYPFQDKYVLHPVTEEECAAVVKLIDVMGPKGVSGTFRRLFKDYPSLAKPFDDATQAAVVNFFRDVIAVGHDEKAVATKASPFVMELYEQKFISWTYWWRIAEKLMDQIETLQETRNYETRCTRMVIERVTKIIYNSFADLPWAHAELTSPYHFDICTYRAYHDLGLW